MDNDRRLELARVASMYYEEGMTQRAIGAELGLSRIKVYRLLKEARAEGVVQIAIDWPLRRDGAMEAALESAFKLRQALVLQVGPANLDAALQRLGRLGAQYLEQTLNDGMTLAVCLGRSTYEVIDAIRPGFQAKVNVAQAMGSLPFAMGDLDSAALARRLAQRLGGDVLYLSSPLIAESAADAAVLRNQRDIRRALDAARRADVALLGIGTLDPESSGLVGAGFLAPEELEELIATGAVGDVAGCIYTGSGELHPTPVNQRVIGVDLEDLRAIPLTVAAAMGAGKASAIVGALRGGLVDVLVTDARTAAAVLELGEW